MGFGSSGGSVTTITSADVTAATLFPLSLSSGSDQIAADQLFSALARVGASSQAVVANTLVVQQPAGTPGTDEVQVYHDGTDGFVTSKDGRLVLQSGGSGTYIDLISPGGVVRLSTTTFLIGAANAEIQFTNQLTWNADTGLGWGGAGVVKITNSTTGSGTLSSKPLAPAQIAASTNNYSPGTARTYLLTSDAARSVTGLVAGVDGEERYFTNTGSFPITLVDESSSSTAANRFTNAGSADIVLGIEEWVRLVYSSAAASAVGRWLVTKTRSDAGQGTLIVRQPGGTPGSSDVLVFNDGSRGIIQSKQGVMLVYGTTGVQISDTGNAINVAFTHQVGQTLPADESYRWSSSAGDATATGDIGLSRLAAGVAKVNDGSTGSGWLQNTAGEASLTTAFTRSDTTLTNTALSLTVIAGRSYRVTGCLQVSNSTATEGVKFDFAGGTATATTFFAGAYAAGSVTAGTVTSVSLAGVINYSVITGTDLVYFFGFLKVNAGGTIILRAAENSTALGTATLGAGSWMALNDTVQL